MYNFRNFLNQSSNLVLKVITRPSTTTDFTNNWRITRVLSYLTRNSVKFFDKSSNLQTKEILQININFELNSLSDHQQKRNKNNFFGMSSDKPEIVFVLGGPGAGKGTQCQKIVKEFGFVHLSAGDLLREERAREGSEFGEMIEGCIRNGTIVPVEVTCSLLEAAINKNMAESGKIRFLIDGFPRNQDNLDGWNRQMSEKVNLLFVLFFDCNDSVCVSRCLERGKSGSGRADDNEEILKKRIRTYTSDSLPIIDHYIKLNKVRKIDASPSADSVFETVKKAFLEI